MDTPTLINRARVLLGGPPLDKLLADFALAFAESLPGLYRTKHDVTAGMHGPETCEAAFFEGRGCVCGLKEQNALLDALADKLGIPPEQRRKP